MSRCRLLDSKHHTRYSNATYFDHRYTIDVYASYLNSWHTHSEKHNPLDEEMSENRCLAEDELHIWHLSIA